MSLVLFISQMVSVREEDSELDFCIVPMEYCLRNKERLPYGPRRAPMMERLQWVEEKEKQPQIYILLHFHDVEVSVFWTT